MTGKINPWVIRKLPQAEKRGSPLNFIVEVAPGTREAVKAQLGPLQGLSILSQPADRFITVKAPSGLLPRIAAIPEVVKVSAETLVWIRSPFRASGIIKFDPWIGEVRLSSVEIEVDPLGGLATLPLRWAGAAGSPIFTTDQVRNLLGIPKENKIKTRVATLDTGGMPPGFPFIHPNTGVELVSTVKGDPSPLDSMSHGIHVLATAWGDDFTHPRYGRCEGMSDAEEILSVKVLHGTFGFGMTSEILEGLWRAYQWGAKVVNLSLGGPAEGSALDDDPMSRLMMDLAQKGVIFCVAAGNEGEGWSIGSPGICPLAITVGSWGITRNALAGFSSKGPNSEFYRDNPEVWERDLARVGENLVKPDLVCYGGDDLASEKILSAGLPWYGPLTDPVPFFSIMHGTSQATPAAAGLIALALDRGIIRTVEDVKTKMSHHQAKNSEAGYGLITWSKLQ